MKIIIIIVISNIEVDRYVLSKKILIDT